MLQHCREVAVTALRQCQGIVRAFIQDRHTVKRMDLVIAGALEEIDRHCPKEEANARREDEP